MSARRWHFVWLLPGWRFDVHSDRDCHRLSVTVWRIGFRWLW